ncbi:MAG: ATP-binding protein [Bacteroidota bacterium]|nr:ATP-binding protein [Bacteroidota bacterium]
MSTLIKFLAFIKQECLEEAAIERLRISKEINSPLLSHFSHLPPETLIGMSMKSFSEFADSMAEGNYIEKQKENLKNWEGNQSGNGLTKENIQPSDLIMMYAAQKKALHKFLPRFAKDPEEMIKIINELEDVHSTLQDISVNMLFEWRKETELHLTQANSFLDTLLENIPNMIFVKDAAELRFVRFNKAGEELLGFKKEELKGKNDFDFFPEEQADFFTKKDKEVLAGGKLVDIAQEEIETLKKGTRWLHTKKIPLPGPDGKPLFLLGISEDITEKKIQEDINKQLNKELEAFTYTVSHDLRAPLRAISGYATMFEEDYGKGIDEEGKRLIEVIRYNAEKMGCLIDDLLAFSKLGRKELDCTFENMTELVEGVVRECSKCNPNNAQIKLNNLISAKMDYGLIHQVWFNLITNAIKYSSKKENPLIEISSEKKDKEIIYSIKDNGVGFNMKYIDKLFGVFQRLHRMDEFEGTGVGLAIVQRIVSKHKGRVWAQAEPDKGATFSFSLPVE